MLEYYVRYNIITIIPIDKSVYLYAKLPSNMKLSKKLIELNYISKSPFVETSIFSYKKDTNLSLWFSPQKRYSSLFVVPEGFLVYFVLSKLGDGLYRLSFKDNKQFVIYIEKGILLLEFLLTDISQLQLLEHQYSLKVQDISYQRYQEISSELWKNPTFLKELKNFINIELSKDKLLYFFDKYLYYPIVFVILLYISISSYQSYSMQSTIDKLTHQYHQLKKQNTQLKQAIKKHNQEVGHLNELINTELNHYDPMQILASLRKIIHKNDKAKITALTISTNSMKITIKTKDDAIKYFRRLEQLGYFKDISISNTHKMKTGEKLYTYSLVLKAIL